WPNTAGAAVCTGTGFDQLPSATKEHRSLTEDAFTQADAPGMSVEEKQRRGVLATHAGIPPRKRAARCIHGCRRGGDMGQLWRLVFVAITERAVQVAGVAHQSEGGNGFQSASGCSQAGDDHSTRLSKFCDDRLR